MAVDVEGAPAHPGENAAQRHCVQKHLVQGFLLLVLPHLSNTVTAVKVAFPGRLPPLLGFASAGCQEKAKNMHACEGATVLAQGRNARWPESRTRTVSHSQFHLEPFPTETRMWDCILVHTWRG